MRKTHMHYLVPLAYLKYTGFRGVCADAWRACQLGIRRLKNLGNRDFLQIGDRLVFSCLEDYTMMKGRHGEVDFWSYSRRVVQLPPLPLDSLAWSQTFPSTTSLSLPGHLAPKWLCLYFTHQTLATLLPFCVFEICDNRTMYDSLARCDHANSHANSPGSQLCGQALWKEMAANPPSYEALNPLKSTV